MSSQKPSESSSSAFGAEYGFRQALTDAQEQLASIDTDLRGRLHKEFLQQVAQVEPLLREQGRRVGLQLLQAFTQPRRPAPVQSAPAPSTEDAADMAEEMGTFSPWPRGFAPSSLVDCSMDDMRDRFKMYLDPVLDPFIGGLTEPFAKAAGQAWQQGVGAMILGCAVSAAIGFVAGSWWRGSQGRKP